MNQEVCLTFLCLLSLVLGAPVDIKEESKRRETTRETLELENALKRLAGENKKTFPGPGLQPMPQVDGLEDRPEDDLAASLPGGARHQDNAEEEDETDETLQTDGEADNVNTEQVVESDSTEEEDLDHLRQIQPEINEDVEEGKEIEEDEDQEQDMAQDVDAGREPSDFDDVPNSLQPSEYGGQQQALGDSYSNIQYGQDYPAYGDLEGDVSNEDYLVQDVMEMMEKHPELWARLLQARNMNLMEETEPQYADLYDQMQLQNIPGRNQQIDDVQNLPEVPRYSMQSPNELYNDEETLRNMQQYEKLQDFYGDKTAHVVAKKQGYGPMVDYPQIYNNEFFNRQSEEDIEGSGENEVPQTRVTMDETITNNRIAQNMGAKESNSKMPVFKVPMM